MAELGYGFEESAADGVFVAGDVGEVGAEGALGEAVAQEEGVAIVWPRGVGAGAALGEWKHAAPGAFEHAGFDAGNALQAPIGGGDLQDEQFFKGANGLKVVLEGGKEFEEDLIVLAGDGDIAGEEAVLEGVAAGGDFAFGGLGAGAQESVAAVGVSLRLGWHKRTSDLMVGGGGWSSCRKWKRKRHKAKSKGQESKRS